MIHCTMFNNYGDRHSPDYDSTDPVATHKIPGDSVDDLINFLGVRVPHVVDSGSIITDTSICVWYAV